MLLEVTQITKVTIAKKKTQSAKLIKFDGQQHIFTETSIFFTFYHVQNQKRRNPTLFKDFIFSTMDNNLYLVRLNNVTLASQSFHT